jgi:hypothetical protein
LAIAGIYLVITVRPNEVVQGRGREDRRNQQRKQKVAARKVGGKPIKCQGDKREEYSYFSFFFIVVLGLELWAYTSERLHQPFFVKSFFEIGSHDLFAQAGFEP